MRTVHELGLSEAIVDAAVQGAGGRRVRSLRVRVGGAHAADPEAVRLGFQMAALGTVAEGAVLDLVSDPPRIRCAGCGKETRQDGGPLVPACPACGGVDVEVAGLDQLEVEDLSVDGAGG